MRALPLLVVVAACSNDVALGGPSSLVRVDAELPGANCAQGGVAIKTGLDTNGNGYLDDSEVTSTQYVCNGDTDVTCGGGTILTGTITIASDADLAQLQDVSCVDGDLLVAGLDTDSIALLPLATVTGDVVIAGNAHLTSLDGFGDLREVGGSVLVQGNDALVDITELGQLQRADALQLVGDNALVDVAGLAPLGVFHGGITIADNGAMTTLHGLEGLTIVDKTISITSNRHLISLAALDSLRSVSLIEVSGNTALTDLGLTGLEKVDVRVILTSNAVLPSATLPALASVGDFMRFDSNGALATIDAPTLVTAGSLQVTNDPTVATVTAPRLAFATAGVDFANLPALTHLDLTAMSTIGAELHVITTPQLHDLTGLASLQSIGGDLDVEHADALTSFHGLDQLGLVSGDVTFENNAVLASYAGLGQLTEIGGSLTISANPKLPVSSSTAWASGDDVRGAVSIHQ